MSESTDKTYTMMLVFTAIAILLLVAVTGLFVRMHQLQQEVLTALAAKSVAGIQGRETGLEAGTSAPPMTMLDLDGERIDLADYRGRTVLLGFFSTTCPGCIRTAPQLRSFSDSRDDVEVLLVSLGSVTENRRMAAEQGFNFPILPLTEDSTVGLDYRVPGTPFFYVIDQAGIINYGAFAHTQAQLAAMVDRVAS